MEGEGESTRKSLEVIYYVILPTIQIPQIPGIRKLY